MSRKLKQDTPDQPDLVEAAKSGDKLETLIALRDLLAQRLQNTNVGRDVSTMARRLMECVCEIETLEKEKAEKDKRFTLQDYRERLKYTERKDH